MSDRNDLPSATSPNFQARLRETLQTYLGRQGNPLDRGITLRDLLVTGIATLRPGEAPVLGAAVPPIVPVPPDFPVYTPDLTPPPAPASLTATPAISHIILEVPAATYTQGHGHLRTRVYGANPTVANPTPTFSDAVEVGQFSGTVWALNSNPSTTWHLWAKYESNDNVLSATPVGGANGVVATTGEDVESLVLALTGPGNPFTILTAPTVIDGVTFPAGTYSTQSFILDAQITNAKIANAAIDNAKVANLSASKLTAGSITAGEFVGSTGYVAGSAGWRINGDGSAEFSGVVVRGTIFASAGLIGGSLIGPNYMRSTTYVLGSSGWNFNSDGTGQVGGMTLLNDALQSNNFVAGSAGWRLRQDGSIEANSGTYRGNVSAGQFTTGSITGYAWPPAGAGNFGTYLGPLGLLIGNANNGKYFQVESDGDIYAPGFSVVNGTLTINQANVINTLNLAGQAVTIPVSAFTAANSGSLGSGWTSVQSVFLSSSGAPIIIFAEGDFVLVGGGDGAVAINNFGLRILRNGALIAERAYTGQSYGGDISACAFFVQDTAGATGVTYTLQARQDQGGSVTNRGLFCLETKR